MKQTPLQSLLAYVNIMWTHFRVLEKHWIHDSWLMCKCTTQSYVYGFKTHLSIRRAEYPREWETQSFSIGSLWARITPGSRTHILTFHEDGKVLSTGAIMKSFPVHWQEAGLEAEWLGSKPELYKWCQCLKWHLNPKCVSIWPISILLNEILDVCMWQGQFLLSAQDCHVYYTITTIAILKEYLFEVLSYRESGRDRKRSCTHCLTHLSSLSAY